jgi:hypothetical protein
MTNDQIPMTNVRRLLFLIGHSSFVIRNSSFAPLFLGVLCDLCGFIVKETALDMPLSLTAC